MLAITENISLFAVLGLGGEELIIVLGAVLVLFGSKRIPEFGQGLRRGFSEFRKAAKEVEEELDGQASDAGRSLGGIYGKPSAQLLTPDNQIAELYRPAASEDERKVGRKWGGPSALLRKVWRWLRLLVFRDKAKNGRKG